MWEQILIKDIHDLEKVVSSFVHGKFDTKHVHVLHVDYDKEIWTAEGGFVAKDCPLAIFTIKVDREGNILSQRIACAIPATSTAAEKTYV